MAFDLLTAKAYLGLPATPDPALDGQVRSAMDIAWSIAENYCKRLLKHRNNHVEHLVPGARNAAQMELYPVTSDLAFADTSIAFDSDNLDKKAGIYYGLGGKKSYTVTYGGGYIDPDTPLDLELALLGILKNVTYPVFSGGGATITGAIDSITIPDVGTVRYSNGAAAATSTGGGSATYGSFYNLLDNYVLHRA